MPTGYTSGIIDGKINTFPDFAKLCMRAFGATIHMRDENLDIEYEPRKVSNYYLENIEETKKKLINIKKQSNDSIIKSVTRQLNNDKKYNINKIKEIKVLKDKLTTMLNHAIDYIPPTKEHVGIKEFMIQQITDTIKWDCDDEYHVQKLERIEKELKNIDPKLIRKDRIQMYEEDLVRYQKQYDEELLRCLESNKWVTNFLNSINNETK
jgi:hypothetical protein